MPNLDSINKNVKKVLDKSSIDTKDQEERDRSIMVYNVLESYAENGNILMKDDVSFINDFATEWSYRPVANLSFISKIIEKAIATQIHDHLINNDIVDNFQSAYKAGHSCETALLRVYNDIVTTIGRGNGAMLVLPDLAAAFDTIDHDKLFCILAKYVGICGNALKLIKSYFSNRTQRVQIDDVLSDFANIICGVPQGSVLGPLKFSLDLLPMSAISKYHKIGYHMLTTLNYISHPNVNNH